MNFRLFSSLLSAGLLTACAVGPDYQRPALPVPADYPEGSGGARPVSAQWWKEFGDPRLDELVAVALSGNADLRLAAARVEEAAGGLQEVAGAQYPQVNATAAASQNQVSLNGYSPVTSFAGRDRVSFQAGLSTAFELDFWGRLRRASEAARAQLLGAREARQQVELGVVSSVVRAYALVLSADVQCASAESVRAVREEEARIISERLHLGAAGVNEQAQAQVLLSAAVAASSDARRARAQAEHLLGFLLGQPGFRLPAAEAGVPLSPAAPAVGLPSDLLRLRPDVLAAEQALVAANARIGYAKAAYFPSFTLTGALGSESRQLGELFGTGTGTSSAGLNVSVPLLDFGRTSARVRQAVAVQHQAAAAYEKTVLTAFREVRDALADVRETALAMQAAERREESAGQAYRIAEERRRQGQLSPFEFLTAQRLLAESRAAVARVRLDRVGAQVDLIKALGGSRVDQVAAR